MATRRRFLALMGAVAGSLPISRLLAEDKDSSKSKQVKTYSVKHLVELPTKDSSFEKAHCLISSMSKGVGADSKIESGAYAEIVLTGPVSAINTSKVPLLPNKFDSVLVKISLDLKLSADGKLQAVVPQTNANVQLRGSKGSYVATAGKDIIRPYVSFGDKPVMLQPEGTVPWNYRADLDPDEVWWRLKLSDLKMEIGFNRYDIVDGKPVVTQQKQAGLTVLTKGMIDRLLAANVKAFRNNAANVKEVEPLCFITTLVCDHVGLLDDCWELQALRAFRDRWASCASDNQAMVDEYYRIAPSFCQNISTRPDAHAICRSLYAKYILPMAVLSSARLDRFVVPYYKRMVALASTL